MPRNKKILVLAFCFIFSSTYLLKSQIFNDAADDHELTITIDDSSGDKKNNDETSDFSRDSTSDTTFGNKWYSRHNIYISQITEMGLAGSKDFLKEYFLLDYRIKSRNRHAFSIRLFHIGYTTGMFSNHFEFYNFSAAMGFEYFYKIFSNIEGIFLWLDLGGCNKGISFNAGFGIGSRIKNGLEFWISYLQNIGIFFCMDFYFLIFKFFTLRGKLGINLKYSYINDIFNIDVFDFHGGFFMGFFIKKVFRIEFGGGFTVNEFSAFRGYGGINLAFNIL